MGSSPGDFPNGADQNRWAFQTLPVFDPNMCCKNLICRVDMRKFRNSGSKVSQDRLFSPQGHGSWILMCRTPRPELLGKEHGAPCIPAPSSHRAWLFCFAPDTFVPIRSSQLSPQPESTTLRGYETTCMPEWRTLPLARPPNDDANDGAPVRACTNRRRQGSPPIFPGPQL